MILQLNPLIPVMTPKGKGYAHFLIDYSQDHDLYWVCFIDNTGECFTFSNKEIKIDENLSMGRSYKTTGFNQPIVLNEKKPVDLV